MWPWDRILFAPEGDEGGGGGRSRAGLTALTAEQIENMSEEDLAAAVMADEDLDLGQDADDNPDNPDEGPGDQPDNPEDGPEAPDGDGGEGQDADDPGNAILRRARELGWDHDFKSVDEMLEGVVNLRRFAGRKQEHEDIGKLAAEAGLSPEELRAMVEEAQEGGVDPATSWRPPVKYDPEWERVIRVADDGSIEGPQDKVAAYQRYEQYKRDFWNRAGNDPSLLVRSFQNDIRQMVMHTLAQERAQTQAQKFVEEHKEIIASPEFRQHVANGIPPQAAAVMIRQARELEELRGKAGGQGARAADVRALNKPTRRAPRTGGRQTARDVDLSNLTEEQLAELALRQAGINLPALDT